LIEVVFTLSSAYQVYKKPPTLSGVRCRTSHLPA